MEVRYSSDELERLYIELFGKNESSDKKLQFGIEHDFNVPSRFEKLSFYEDIPVKYSNGTNKLER